MGLSACPFAFKADTAQKRPTRRTLSVFYHAVLTERSGILSGLIVVDGFIQLALEAGMNGHLAKLVSRKSFHNMLKNFCIKIWSVIPLL